MEALFLLIPLSLLGIGVAVWIFFRMSDSGQFDDLDSPAHGVLLDDDTPGPPDVPGQAPRDPSHGDDAPRRNATSPPKP
jgi:cbb3-type cytochrome oxidase maturation protein